MTMVRVRRARKTRLCEEFYGPWAHDPLIAAGDLYVTLVLPPKMAYAYGAGDGTRWMSTRLCIPCAVGHGLDATIVKVIDALYDRGVLEQYDPPPKLVLRAGRERGLREKQRADATP